MVRQYRKNKTEEWFRSGFFISELTAAEPKLNTKLSKTVILTVNTIGKIDFFFSDERFASDFVKFGHKRFFIMEIPLEFFFHIDNVIRKLQYVARKSVKNYSHLQFPSYCSLYKENI